MSTTVNKRSQKPPVASTRINLRITPQVKGILMRAARLQQVNLTEFMLKSSRLAAEMALADRTRFVVSPVKWQEFNAALDGPPREIPALRKLFREPSVFSTE